MKLDGKRLVWPANIDSSKTRLEGRKIPKSACVQAPRIEELTEAARRLSTDVEVSHHKSRPKAWWEKTGYLTIPKKTSKSKLLRSLSAEVRKMRASKSEESKK
jgi:signal recognition particle subunit SRP19